MSYCSCLPIYTPGGPGQPSTPVCPPGCLQAKSFIQPTEQGLECEDIYTVDLTTLTDAGNCENITYSIISDPSVEDYSLVGSVFTFTLNDTTEPDPGGVYIEFVYKMSCDDDPRSVSGSIQLYIISKCEL